MAEGKGGACPAQLIPYQWKKGQSGNPKGRAKKQSFEDLVNRILEEATVAGLDCTPREAVAAKFVEMLLSGNEKILGAFLDRVWQKKIKIEAEFTADDRDTVEAAIDKFLSRDPRGIPKHPLHS